MRKNEVPQNLILDTGFWIAFYEASDEHHAKARELAAYFDFSNLLIPWPSLYETLGTRFTRRAMWLSSFEPILSKSGTVLLPDEAYRSSALASVFLLNRTGRGISLVDMVIRAMIEDVNIKIDAMITFNRQDFLEVCLARNIELISE